MMPRLAFSAQFCAVGRIVMRHLRFFSCAALHGLVIAAALLAADDAVAPPKTFELTVVGPDQKRVAGADIQLRTKPMLRAEDVQRGQFVCGGDYWTLVKADADGQLLIKLPAGATGLNLDI